jgi:hypothetical protein
MKKSRKSDHKVHSEIKMIVKEAVNEAAKSVLARRMHKDIYSIKEVSSIFGKDPQTINRWRKAGIGPAYIYEPKTQQIYYKHEALIEFLGGNPALETAVSKSEVERAIRTLTNLVLGGLPEDE